MKKLITFIIVGAMVCAMCVIDHNAEENYTTALYYAATSNGTDGGIESAMYDYGFDIEAYSSEEITYLQKLEALTK